MGLEVWLKLAGCCNQSEGELLHRWIPLFYTPECPASVVYRSLQLIIFFDQGRIDGNRGYGQVKEQPLILRDLAVVG